MGRLLRMIFVCSLVRREELEQELRCLRAETYVITPSRIAEKIKKTAFSINVVTDRQILQIGAKDIQDVIPRVVSGFWLEHLANVFNSLIVRGGGRTILMMINGRPLYSPDSQGGVYLTYKFIIEGRQ
jgi:outer membrane receptor for ferrienterochelin and colicin